MQRIKDLWVKGLGCLSGAVVRLKKRWRKTAPGFRYALVYFLCVVAITAFVWWQFSPTNSLLFSPETKLDNPATQAPTQETTGTPNRPAEPVYPSITAFVDGKEVLTSPMQGAVLLGAGEVFSAAFHTVSAGIHIGGTRGDSVYSAYKGKVVKVVAPGENQRGAVWLDHGDFCTRYINLEDITVKVGDVIAGAHKLGELGPRLEGPYIEDYLVFEVWTAENEPLDPQLLTAINP